MTVNFTSNFAMNSTFMATRKTASQFNLSSVTTAQTTSNITFQRSSTSVGIVATQFQTRSAVNSATQSCNKFENWCISDHYPISHEEVKPLLRKVQLEIDNASFIGMTKIEIYDFIENKFIEAFGTDFMMAMNLNILDPKSNCPIFNDRNNRLVALGGGDDNGNTWTANFKAIGGAFNAALVWNLYHMGDKSNGNQVLNINRQRLFGDMDDIEIMDTIRAKFPVNLTNRDLALMTSKMRSVGVISFAIASPPERFMYEFYADGTLKRIKSPIKQNDIWLKMLDKPFDISDLLRHFNTVAQAGELNKGNLEFRDFAVRFLGAILGPDGLFVVNDVDIDLQNLKWDFTKMLPNLEEEFIEKLDVHNRNLSRKRDKYSRELDRDRVRAIYEDSSLTPSRKGRTESRPHNSEAMQAAVGA